MVEVLIGNDLVVNEDACNLSCHYCLTGQSNLKASHSDKLIFGPPSRDRYAPDTDLGRRLPLIIRRIDERFTAPLLKVTGGEIFLVDGVMDFLCEEAARHAVLVVQTNGALVRGDQLAQLREWGNVVLQVSLDSHRFPGNSYRVGTPALHDKVVRRVETLLDSGIAAEVYGVLTDRSVEEVVDFAAWLADRPEPPAFFPFPVRGPDAAKFAVRDDQLHHLRELADRRDEFAAVLPPVPYLDRLLRFYTEGGRRFRCHLPRLVISTFGDGVVTPCPNIWYSDMGNVLEDTYHDTLARVGSTGLYQALLAERPRLAACRGCFTPWDVLSLHLEGEITLEELTRSPSYASAAVRDLLTRIAAAVRVTSSGAGR